MDGEKSPNEPVQHVSNIRTESVVIAGVRWSYASFVGTSNKKGVPQKFEVANERQMQASAIAFGRAARADATMPTAERSISSR